MDIVNGTFTNRAKKTCAEETATTADKATPNQKANLRQTGLEAARGLTLLDFRPIPLRPPVFNRSPGRIDFHNDQ